MKTLMHEQGGYSLDSEVRGGVSNRYCGEFREQLKPGRFCWCINLLQSCLRWKIAAWNKRMITCEIVLRKMPMCLGW
jgi:hypothetical protein